MKIMIRLNRSWVYNCPVRWYTVVDEMSVDEMSVDELSWNHYSPTRLLQLTLRRPHSWAVTVPRQGPAHCRTHLWAHPQIWPRFQVYAGCAPLAPPRTEDFVPYNFLNLAVPPGSCSRLSSRPLPHYHGNSGSSLSPLNRA